MPDPDDTDARFRALIEAEYGVTDDLEGDLPTPDSPEADRQDPVRRGEETDGETLPPQVLPFSALPAARSWTPPPEEDEPFVPPPVEPFWPISTPAMLALILLVASLVVAVFALARVPLPWWAPGAGLGCFVVGLVLSFTRLPRDRPPGSDNGAVV